MELFVKNKSLSMTVKMDHIHFSLAKTFLQSYQGIWAIFWASMSRYPNFFSINLLSIKVSN